MSGAFENYRDTDEAAEYLGISRDGVSQAIFRGTLPAVKRRNVWWIHVDDLAAYDRRRRIHPALRQREEAAAVTS